MNNLFFLPNTSIIFDIFLFCFLIFTLITFFWWFAPWLPTRGKDLEQISEMVKLKKGETFYELGCGDARVSFYLAKKFPDSKIIGLEIFLPIFLVAKIKQFFWGQKNLSIKFKNVFWHDLSDADVLYIYGMPESLESPLRKKFLEDLKPKTRIISYVFKMNHWKSDPVIKKSKETKAKIYIYTV